MSRRAIAEIAVVLAAASAAPCRSRQAAPRATRAAGTLVVRGTVVRPDGTPLPDAVVLVEGNRIARVGHASDLAVPRGAAVIGGPDAPPLPERAVEAAARFRAQLPVALANAKRARNAGVLVVAGTDAGNIGTFHGPAIARELELLVQAGLTSGEPLAAGTLGGARTMGRERDLGSVEEGKLADLVVLARTRSRTSGTSTGSARS